MLSKATSLLNSHQDYSLRAKDYSEKKKRLHVLREKVAQRHPEEFNFGMIRSQTYDKGRLLADRKAVSLSQDTARLLKTQDAAYLNVIAQQTNAARCKLEQVCTMQKVINRDCEIEKQGPLWSHHQYFAVTKSEQEFLTPDGVRRKSPAVLMSEKYDGISRELCEKRSTRLLRDVQSQSTSYEKEHNLRKAWREEQTLREAKLELLRKRQKEIRLASDAIEQQRSQMARNAGGITTAGHKWKVRERCR